MPKQPSLRDQTNMLQYVAAAAIHDKLEAALALAVARGHRITGWVPASSLDEPKMAFARCTHCRRQLIVNMQRVDNALSISVDGDALTEDCDGTGPDRAT